MRYFSIIAFFCFSCTDDNCNCQYVVYDDGKETYRSTWDASCSDELISESIYTYDDGTTTYSRTLIECE